MSESDQTLIPAYRYAQSRAATEHAHGSERERDWLDLLRLLDKAEVDLRARSADMEARIRALGIGVDWRGRTQEYQYGFCDGAQQQMQAVLALLDAAPAGGAEVKRADGCPCGDPREHSPHEQALAAPSEVPHD